MTDGLSKLRRRPDAAKDSTLARALRKAADVVKLVAFLVCTVAFGWKVRLSLLKVPDRPAAPCSMQEDKF